MFENFQDALKYCKKFDVGHMRVPLSFRDIAEALFIGFEAGKKELINKKFKIGACQHLKTCDYVEKNQCIGELCEDYDIQL